MNPSTAPGDCLILVKHALPAIDPGMPASRWQLAERGRRRAAALAGRLAGYRPPVILSSVEPKAEQTASIVADRLGLPCHTLSGLHEHERDNVAWIPDPAEFERRVAAFFACPGDRNFGTETAGEACRRMDAALLRAQERYPSGTLAVVSHGTVISLVVAKATGWDPFALWKRLGLPSFVVLERPTMRLVEVVDHIEVGGA